MNVVITGASRGIGFAVAEAFAEHGHPLILTSFNEFRLYKAVEKLQAVYSGIEIHAKPCDLSIAQEAQDFGQWCLQFGTPGVLVNNAGVFEPGEIGSEPAGVLEHQIASNLYSAYHLTRSILPSMKSKGSGHIFNICSVASLQAYPAGGAYSISKHALYGFSRNLRYELKSLGIKVTAVLPGAVNTDSWTDFDNRNHRIMEASDIAKLVYTFTLLSPAACVEDIVVRPQLGDL
jgi:short-subunit dehydrogenase